MPGALLLAKALRIESNVGETLLSQPSMSSPSPPLRPPLFSLYRNIYPVSQIQYMGHFTCNVPTQKINMLDESETRVNY